MGNVEWLRPLHHGSEQPDSETSKFQLSQELGSQWSEQASKQMSAAEPVSEASSASQRTDKRVAQFSCSEFWLIWTKVRCFALRSWEQAGGSTSVILQIHCVTASVTLKTKGLSRAVPTTGNLHEKHCMYALKKGSLSSVETEKDF